MQASACRPHFKAAVAAGSTDPANWAAPLHQYSQLSDGFIASLVGVSVFDSLLSSMRRVPLRVKVAVVTQAATASSVQEGQIKPIGTMAFDNSQMTPQKATGLVVLNDEVIRFSSPSAEAIISQELRAGVARAVDSIFLTGLYSSVSAIASSGTTVTAMVTDLAALIAAIGPTSTSRLFLITDVAAATALALARDGSGAAFPTMTPTGGTVCGIPCLVTDQMPASGNSPGQSRAILVDASGLIAGSDDDITVDIARHTSLQFDSSPDSPETASTNLISLWQHGRIALKAERHFGYDIARSTAVAAMHSINWGF
jgi:HK97 family phage major capsid protein